VDNEKRLIDFLHVLLRLTEENIKFMCGNVTYRVFELDKYKEELCKIQNIINSFDFIEDKKLMCLEWIDVKTELPPIDGSYEVTNHPEKPFDLGVCEYNGLGFIADRIYRNPKFWRYMCHKQKKYGKKVNG